MSSSPVKVYQTAPVLETGEKNALRGTSHEAAAPDCRAERVASK